MTTNTATEQTAAFTLTWSLTKIDETSERPRLELAIELTAAEELYLSDRLWVHDAGGQRVPDPFGVYRFVHGGGLWLVFAQAPWPAEISPRIVFQPLASRVGAGETWRRELVLDLPVDEYSALARDITAETRQEEVQRATLVIGHRLRSTMTADPQPPPRESGAQAGYIVHDLAPIASSIDIVLPVKRRTGPIARYTLP